MMNYRSVSDLNRIILGSLPKIPAGIDLIVGVPRSGLLAANLLALYLNCPLIDVDGFLEGRVMRAGPRAGSWEVRSSGSSAPRVLILDDSINTGAQMAKIRAEVEAAGRQDEVLYGAVFASPNSRHMVDVFFEVVPQPRIFQWNILHSRVLTESCVDIDGVICRDPLDCENDDGPAYEEFLLNADRKYSPTVEVGWLVSCRLEKYRAQTEAWLRNNGVKYGKLILLDMPSKAARMAADIHGRYKAEAYLRTGAELFVESSRRQAAEIAKLTSKQVLCTETWEMEGASQETKAVGEMAVRMIKERLPTPAKILLKGALAGRLK